MFHPERLTGKRARKYAFSISYADPIPAIPKHLQKIIRAPAHHVKYVMKQMPDVLAGVRSAHYIAVIRNRIVALNHEDPAGERALAELSGVKNWRCTCYKMVEMFGNHTRTDKTVRNRHGRKLAKAETKGAIPQDLVALRLKCRKPIGTHRTTYDDGYSDKYAWRDGDTARAPFVPPTLLSERFDKIDLKGKICHRAAEILTAAVRSVIPSSSKRALVRDLHRAGFVKYDGGYQGCQLVVNGQYVYLDPYTWYSRVYTQGLSVLNDWFVTGMTKPTEKEEQQEAVSEVYERGMHPSAQYATAVNLRAIIRRHDAREAPVAVGVVVTPLPGLAWFLPLPKHKAELRTPEKMTAGLYQYNLDAEVDRELTPYEPMAKIRAETRQRM